MHLFSGKIPEVQSFPCCRWVEDSRQLRDLFPEEQRMLINFVFEVLARTFGGYHHFWDDDPNNEEFLKVGWILTLSETSPKKIFVALYLVISCKIPEFVSFPPKAAAGFLNVCNNSLVREITSVPSIESNVVNQPMSDEKKKSYQEAIEKIKAEVKNAIVINNQTNIKQNVFEIERQRQLNETEKQLKDFYKKNPIKISKSEESKIEARREQISTDLIDMQD